MTYFDEFYTKRDEIVGKRKIPLSTGGIKGVRHHPEDRQVYAMSALPLKKGDNFSYDVIGKDKNGLLGIIFYDYELNEWDSHTADFNLEDFVWMYPDRQFLDPENMEVI